MASTGATQRRRLPLTWPVAVTAAGQGKFPHSRMLVKTAQEYPPRTTGLNVGSTDALWSFGLGGSSAVAKRIGLPPFKTEMKRLPSSGPVSSQMALHPVGVVPAWYATAFESGVKEG